MNLPAPIITEIREHAESTYPEECCGVVLGGRASSDEPVRVRRCTNAQDRFHALDPVEFPRTSRNAYFIDPKDLLSIERECDRHQRRICLIYHSHPDVGAYFSEEDQRRAIVDGQPLHPEVDYVVVSVLNGIAGDIGIFSWNGASGNFVRQNIGWD